jgi:hypothetical protein
MGFVTGEERQGPALARWGADRPGFFVRGGKENHDFYRIEPQKTTAKTCEMSRERSQKCKNPGGKEGWEAAVFSNDYFAEGGLILSAKKIVKNFTNALAPP